MTCDHDRLRRNNFDLLRLVLALVVVLVHSHTLSGSSALLILQRLSSEYAVMGFFAISGLLITRSYLRSQTVGQFVGKRIRRLYPAYVVVIVLAVLVGAVMTTIPLTEYVTSRKTVMYLLSNLVLLNFIEPALPGVFVDNPTMPAINGALWSIRSEVLCYLAVPLLCVAAKRIKPAGVCAAAYLLCVAGDLTLQALQQQTGMPIYGMLRIVFPRPAMCFIVGIACCFYFEFFCRYSRSLLIAAVTVIVASAWWPDRKLVSESMPVGLSVLILHLGCRAPYLGNVGRFGDFSYAVYIYHFPIIQSLVAIGLFGTHPLAALWLTLALLFAAAFLSWHLVEKRWLQSDSHYLRANAAGLRGAPDEARAETVAPASS